MTASRRPAAPARTGARPDRSAPAPNATAGFVATVLESLRRARGPVRPWRREDPVSCLVGTILAQATTDRLADRAYRALRRRFPTWTAALEAPLPSVEETIRLSGLSIQKSRAIQAFLRHLKDTRGRISLDELRRPGLDLDAALADLCSVQGVGVKTAAITLMFGCGADLCAVDTHLVRILRRLRIVPEAASPERAFRILRPLVPPGEGIALHLQLIRHGRTICRARDPRCGDCPLRSACPWPAPRDRAGGRRNTAGATTRLVAAPSARVRSRRATPPAPGRDRNRRARRTRSRES